MINIRKKRIFVLVLILTIIILSLIIYLLFNKLSGSSNLKEETTQIPEKSNSSSDSNSEDSSTESTEDYSFEDLTIPYLRSRQYTGKLGNLEKYSENGSYTSYLTSYDSDGLRINGLITIPKDEKPEDGWPAIVFVHGYIPPQDYQTTKNYESYVDYLAKNGFVVFKIDLEVTENQKVRPRAVITLLAT